MNAEGVLVKRFDDGPVRLIVKTLAALFFDHFPLRLENLFRNLKVAHAVRFEPEGHRQVGAWSGFPENGGVFGGVGVIQTARPDNVVRELFRRQVLRALEHQVLEEVRKAGLARKLVLRAHVVPDLDAYHRRVVVFSEEGAQAILENDGVDGSVRQLDGGGERRGQAWDAPARSKNRRPAGSWRQERQ